jgi:hypothetical protein
MSSDDPGSERPAKTRRVIHATCTAAGHGSGFGFTNLVVTKRGGVIVLEPHATGACVIELDEAASRELAAFVVEMLG